MQATLGNTVVAGCTRRGASCNTSKVPGVSATKASITTRRTTPSPNLGCKYSERRALSHRQKHTVLHRRSLTTFARSKDNITVKPAPFYTVSAVLPPWRLEPIEKAMDGLGYHGFLSEVDEDTNDHVKFDILVQQEEVEIVAKAIGDAGVPEVYLTPVPDTADAASVMGVLGKYRTVLIQETDPSRAFGEARFQLVNPLWELMKL